MAEPLQASREGECDVCAGRFPAVRECSQHFIDRVFPEAEEDRKPEERNPGAWGWLRAEVMRGQRSTV